MSTPGRDWDNPEAMLGVDDALRLILAEFSPLPRIQVSLLDAAGLVLAEDVVADTPVPPFQNSAMDGYALRSVDTVSCHPQRDRHNSGRQRHATSNQRRRSRQDYDGRANPSRRRHRSPV